MNWKSVSLCIQGSLFGLISGLIITLWVGIGAQVYPPLPIKTNPLPLSVAGCGAGDTNITTTVAAWSTTSQLTTESRQECFFFSRFCISPTRHHWESKHHCFLPDRDELLHFYVLSLKQQHPYTYYFFCNTIHCMSTECKVNHKMYHLFII